jgi:hypothetical protein
MMSFGVLRWWRIPGGEFHELVGKKRTLHSARADLEDASDVAWVEWIEKLCALNNISPRLRTSGHLQL